MNITALYLIDLGLTYNDLKAIKNSIIKEDTLELLNISNNLLGDESMGALGDILKSNPTITKCYIARNSITDKGAEILLENIQNKNLSVLDLAGNDVENGNIFLSGHHIVKLYSDSNEIKKLDGVPSLPNTVWLDFSRNPDLKSVPQKVLDYFSSNYIYLDLKNTSVEFTDLTGYVMTAEGTADTHLAGQAD